MRRGHGGNDYKDGVYRPEKISESSGDHDSWMGRSGGSSSGSSTSDSSSLKAHKIENSDSMNPPNAVRNE